MPFPKDAVVVVKQVDDQNWELREMLRYRVLPRLDLNIAGRPEGDGARIRWTGAGLIAGRERGRTMAPGFSLRQPRP